MFASLEDRCPSVDKQTEGCWSRSTVAMLADCRVAQDLLVLASMGYRSFTLKV
jgi:hypothetical protein